MRLSTHDRDQIVRLARRHFGAGSRVILFGSRVRDDALGGDIDLLIDTPERVDEPIRREAAFLHELWRQIGEQRVDVVLRAPGLPAQKIHDIATALGVEL